MDTIFAVSSGRPPAAIAVLRISGPAAIRAAETLAGDLPPARQAGVRALRNGRGALLDRALVLVFPAPASATGDDVVELHCHGGRAIVDLVEAALAALPGMRRAEPGEFTRRALMNGRIDLTQAEGLADLLAAETARQHRAAIGLAEGRLSGMVGEWLDTIAMLSARCEAVIDYGDEGDVAGQDVGAIIREARALGEVIGAAADGPPVERLRDGVRVVLAGPPNSGKSTLLNALAGREAAIVTPVAGTTRDRIEVPVSRDGIPYVLIDTAGLTDTDDVVEAIGVGRAERAMLEADILLWLGDDAPPVDAVRVHSRADLPGRRTIPDDREIATRSDDSSTVAALWHLIAAKAEDLLPSEDAVPLGREQIAVCLEASSILRDIPDDVLLAAEHLRRVRVMLSRMLGREELDVMLDALFSRFCLGK